MEYTIKKYMDGYRWGYWILTAICAGLFVLLLGFLLFSEGAKPIGLFIFGVLTVLTLIPQWKSKKFYKELEVKTSLLQLQNDFDKSIPFCDGKLRLGDQWIFCKGQQQVVAYGEIARVFEYVHKSNFVENERRLMYRSSKGKDISLCKLALRGKSDAEVTRVLSLLLQKNPNIQIGYEK